MSTLVVNNQRTNFFKANFFENKLEDQMPIKENVNLKLLSFDATKKICIVQDASGKEHEAKFHALSVVCEKNIQTWFQAPEVSFSERKHVGVTNKAVIIGTETKKVSGKKVEGNPRNVTWISVNTALKKDEKILRTRVEGKVLFCVYGSTKQYISCMQDLSDERGILFVHSDQKIACAKHAAVGFVKRFDLNSTFYIEDGVHQTIVHGEEIDVKKELKSLQDVEEGFLYEGKIRLIDTSYVKIGVPKVNEGAKYKLSPRKKRKAEENQVDYQVDYLCYVLGGQKEEFKLRFCDPVLKHNLREVDQRELEAKHWSDQADHLKELFGVDLEVTVAKIQGQYHATHFAYGS